MKKVLLALGVTALVLFSATPANAAPPVGVSHQCASFTPGLGGSVAGYRLVICLNKTIYRTFGQDIFIAQADYRCMRGTVYLRCYQLIAQGLQDVTLSQFVPHWTVARGKLCGLGQVDHCVAAPNVQNNIVQVSKKTVSGTCYWWQAMAQHVTARLTVGQSVAVSNYRDSFTHICD